LRGSPKAAARKLAEPVLSLFERLKQSPRKDTSVRPSSLSAGVGYSVLYSKGWDSMAHNKKIHKETKGMIEKTRRGIDRGKAT